ncbi:MAG: serine/threonine protein kinase [Spirulina sp. SIO3F2]|nr:serine/threonine protein kinase [Spirulina sp. SIO3F2]
MNYWPIADLLASPYTPLLAYPQRDRASQHQRIEILKQLGIAGIYAAGSNHFEQVPILGMGYRGVVLLGHSPALNPAGGQVAIKLRRQDAPLDTLNREAQMLQWANQIAIGPKLYKSHPDVLVMAHCAGQPLERWLHQPPPPEQVQNAIAQILHQAYQLDRLGLDHGELGCVTEHVQVDPAKQTITLLDFGSASGDRRAANVTTVAQGLFIGTQLAPRLAQILPIPERSRLIAALRAYKQASNPRTFCALLAEIGLNSRISI